MVSTKSDNIFLNKIFAPKITAENYDTIFTSQLSDLIEILVYFYQIPYLKNNKV